MKLNTLSRHVIKWCTSKKSYGMDLISKKRNKASLTFNTQMLCKKLDCGIYILPCNIVHAPLKMLSSRDLKENMEKHETFELCKSNFIKA